MGLKDIFFILLTDEFSGLPRDLILVEHNLFRIVAVLIRIDGDFVRLNGGFILVGSGSVTHL